MDLGGGGGEGGVETSFFQLASEEYVDQHHPGLNAMRQGVVLNEVRQVIGKRGTATGLKNENGDAFFNPLVDGAQRFFSVGFRGPEESVRNAWTLTAPGLDEFNAVPRSLKQFDGGNAHLALIERRVGVGEKRDRLGRFYAYYSVLISLGLFGGFVVMGLMRNGAFSNPLKQYQRSGCCGCGPKLDGKPVTVARHR